MTAHPVSIDNMSTHIIRYSDAIIRGLESDLVKTKVVLVAFNILCASVGIAATFYASRYKLRYITILLGAVNGLGMLFIVMGSINCYEKESKPQSIFAFMKDKWSQILNESRLVNSNITFPDAVRAFYNKKTQASFNQYLSAEKSRSTCAPQAEKIYFYAKLDEAFAIAVNKCTHSTKSPLTWMTISTEIPSYKDDEIFVRFSDQTTISCDEMFFEEADKLSERLIAVMNKIEPPPPLL